MTFQSGLREARGRMKIRCDDATVMDFFVHPSHNLHYIYCVVVVVVVALLLVALQPNPLFFCFVFVRYKLSVS